jgi:hypothetical protein
MSEKYRIAVGDLKKALPELLHRVEELHEFNPMLGHRGCRLGITYPEITEMQARAIFEAVVLVAKKGIKVIPEVMIPLVGDAKELEHQRTIVKRIADEVLGKAGLKKQHYLIGTMIEILRAAITADKGPSMPSSSVSAPMTLRRPPWVSRVTITRNSQRIREPENLQGRPLRVNRSGRYGQVDRNGHQAGAADPPGSRNRDLRRARRRA